jgi:hypothetical protein
VFEVTALPDQPNGKMRLDSGERSGWDEEEKGKEP